MGLGNAAGGRRGFLAGYALLGLPKLPPRNGSDWLFWLAFPVTLLGMADAMLGRRWTWIFACATGVVGLVMVRPLAPANVTFAECGILAVALAAVGMGIVLLLQAIEPRIGSGAIPWGLCIAVGGAAVTVMSSNLRTVGTYGIAASAALGSVALFAGTMARAEASAL